MNTSTNRRVHDIDCIVGKQRNMSGNSKQNILYITLHYRLSWSQLRWTRLGICSLEFLNFVCLDVFSAILCLWNYRKCMTVTLLNKIIFTVAILSKCILLQLRSHISCFGKQKNPKLHIMNLILFIVSDFLTDLWISRAFHLAVITHDALKSISNSKFQNVVFTK